MEHQNVSKKMRQKYFIFVIKPYNLLQAASYACVDLHRQNVADLILQDNI